MKDGTPYMPSDSTDGLAFEARFCKRCLREPLSQEAVNRCPHLTKTFFGEGITAGGFIRTGTRSVRRSETERNSGESGEKR